MSKTAPLTLHQLSAQLWEPGASVGSLVLLRQKAGTLWTPSAISCCLLAPNSSGPNNVEEDECFLAYVQNITLYIHSEHYAEVHQILFPFLSKESISA